MDQESKQTELGISISTAIKIFNNATGASCNTLEETVAYLKDHPEVQRWFAAGPPKHA